MDVFVCYYCNCVIALVLVVTHCNTKRLRCLRLTDSDRDCAKHVIRFLLICRFDEYLQFLSCVLIIIAILKGVVIGGNEFIL